MNRPPDDAASAHRADADRDLLTGIAFRLLGSRAEAEDAVQEAFSRWYAREPGARAAVTSPTAWLVTVVSRICLDTLKSARVRRERYVGPWLPEPLPTSTEPAAARHRDPGEQVALDESVGVAMLLVMEAMTPAERVAFVLHDVFGFPYGQIATALGRTPAACRQLASSGRRRLRADRAATTTRGRDPGAVDALLRAWSARDLPALVRLLDPDAVAVVDGGGLVSAPTEPLVGAAAVAGLLLDVADRVPDLALSAAEVGGTPGLVARDGRGAVLAVLSVGVERGRVAALLVTRNPAKLTAWS